MTSFPYDVALTVGSTKQGYMLVTPPGQSKQLSIAEVPIPSGIYQLNRIKTHDAATHEDFDIGYDVVQSQSSLTTGLGTLEFTDKSDDAAYWWGNGIVTHTQDKAYLAPKIDTLNIGIGQSGDFPMAAYDNGSGTVRHYCAITTSVFARDPSVATNAWVLVYTAPGAITDIKVIDGIVWMLANLGAAYYGWGTPLQLTQWITPTAYTTATFTGKYPGYFACVRGTTYAFCYPNKVYYNTDPTVVGGWVGPIDTTLAGNFSGPPGDKTYQFIGVEIVNNFLFGFKLDGVYAIDPTQEVSEVIWQWRNAVSGNNFGAHAVGSELLFFNVANEVYAYDPYTGRTIPLDIGKMAGVSISAVRGVSADNRYVYVLANGRAPKLRSSVSNFLLRGVRIGAAAWAFECLAEWTADADLNKVGVHALASGTTTCVYYQDTVNHQINELRVPPDWDESTGSNFTSTGQLYCSIWRTGFPNFTKRWLWLAVQAEASAGNTIQCAYSTDLGATFTNIGSAIANNTLTFLDFGPPPLNAQSIVLRFTFTSANGTVSPVLRVYDLHSRVRWRYLRQVTAALRVADNIEDGKGTNPHILAATYKTQLEAARESDTNVLYEDYLGNSFYVSVDKLSYHPTRQERPGKGPVDTRELEADVVLSEASVGA